MNEPKWRTYFAWRKENGRGLDRGPPKDGTIRHEMKAFLAILNFAADKQYIRERHVPRGQTLRGTEASALMKNDPFLLTKSDPHREHDLARANDRSCLYVCIIHAEGVLDKEMNKFRLRCSSSARFGALGAVDWRAPNGRANQPLLDHFS